MRRWLAFVLPFTVVFVVGVAAIGANVGWMGEADRPDPTYIAFAELADPPPVVRLSGMAHYTGVVTQRVPGGLFREPEIWYLYGLFAPYDTESRNIRLLVRTRRAPEHLVSYELMTVEGRLEHPTVRKVPFDTEVLLGRGNDYFFADDLLLIEPWTIESGLDPRARPTDPDD